MLPNIESLKPHLLEPSEVVAILETDEMRGLDDRQASQRVALFGSNELAAIEPVRLSALIRSQLMSPMIAVLVVAIAISLGLNEVIDAIVIATIVVINTTIGVVQEWNADRALAALQRMFSPTARVLRSSRETVVTASTLVPGDVLIVEAGDVLSADARVIEASSLSAMEAALTGESDAVTKRSERLSGDTSVPDQVNMLFSGTTVTSGIGKAVVTATGLHSQLGQIARDIQAAPLKSSPFQSSVKQLGSRLLIVTIVIIGVISAVAVLRGMSTTAIIMSMLSLAVAAIPEGLPAIVTIALASGVSRMTKKGALVRKLQSIETLGAIDTICTDKTGTLTMGQMTVCSVRLLQREYIVDGVGFEPKGSILELKDPSSRQLAPDASLLLNIANLCNTASIHQDQSVWKCTGDPMEGALLALAQKGDQQYACLWPKTIRLGMFPFDTERKLMSVHVCKDEELLLLTKGSPDNLFQRCNWCVVEGKRVPLSDALRQEWQALIEGYATKGLRVLGFAFKQTTSEQPVEERDLTFIGLTGISDPLRVESRSAIEACMHAGIEVKMITGDHPLTAATIGHKLGLSTESITTGDRLQAMQSTSTPILAETTIFARVTAEHKPYIIDQLKRKGHIIAMTGDGVNDAAALRLSDVGIAMGTSGTEVTKQAADIVITDDNFSTIVDAIKEGRNIYQNIRLTLEYLLSGNLAELILLAAAIIAGLPLPLLPIHLLWINLVTDGLPALAIVNARPGSNLMLQPPRQKASKLLDGSFWQSILSTALFGALGGFVLIIYFADSHKVQTLVFAYLVYFELLRSLSIGRRLFRGDAPRLRTNWTLVVVVFLSISFQIWTHHSAVLENIFNTDPLSLSECALLLAYALAILLSLELWRGLLDRLTIFSALRRASRTPTT